MMRGIFALFFRSLRVDARSIWVHLSWLFLLVVIYIALWFAQEQSRFFGAPGLQFFRSVIYLNAIFVTLLGTSYFSSVISEERELDTLGLMMMAGISPLGILMGKSTTRLFQIFLLLALQYPFTLLAITLGGLMPDQIFAAYASLFAYTGLLANVGLLSSVLSRRNRDATGLTTLWLIGYLTIPPLAWAAHQFLLPPAYGRWANSSLMIAWSPTLKPILLWISQTSVFGELHLVTETGYQFQWTPQLISNSLGGLFLFLMSWWLFPYVSHDPASEATTRAMVPRRMGRLRWFSAGRTWNNALVWKDFHFIAGGWFGVFIRCGLYVGLYWLAYLTIMTPWMETSDMYATVRWQDITVGYQIFVIPLFAVDCALCISRIFSEEIRQQTLASLLMLPRTIPNIVYSKLAGCLLGMTPGFIGLFAAFFLLEGATAPFYDMVRYNGAISFTIYFVAQLLLAIHLCAMFSLYMRWGALAMAAALTIGWLIISSTLVNVLRFSMGMPGPMDISFVILAVPTLLACAACHLIVLLRLPALGEK